MTSLHENREVHEVAVTKAQVSAARLRIVTDRRLGRETPDWIRRVAEAEPKAHEPASEEE